MVLTMSRWLYFPQSAINNPSAAQVQPLVQMDTNPSTLCLSVLWLGPQATVFPLTCGVGTNMLLLTILPMGDWYRPTIPTRVGCVCVRVGV